MKNSDNGKIVEIQIGSLWILIKLVSDKGLTRYSLKREKELANHKLLLKFSNEHF